MVKEKLVPELRFPGFSENWEKEKLGELLRFKNGVNASKEQYGKGIKFINVLDILENNYITYEKIMGNVDIDKKTFENNEVNYGDVLFQRSSETREEVGTANVYLDTKKATFGGFVIRGEAISEYDPAFMNYLLKSPFSRNEIMKKSGGSTRYNVGQKTLSEVVVISPSIPEQKKIGKLLSTLDQRIELQERKLENLEEKKKGIIQKIFKQEIKFKDNKGNEYPKWEEQKLGEISIIKTGNSDVQDANEGGKYPFFDRSSDIKYLNDYLYDNEAIIYAGEGSKFLPKYYKGKYALHQRCYSIHHIDEIHDAKYLYYYLNTQNNHLGWIVLTNALFSFLALMSNKR